MANKNIFDRVKQDRPTIKLGDNQAGEILIADEVIAMIAALAASETDGVSNVGNTYTSEIMSKVGVRDKTKGVKLVVEDGEVSISLAISLKNGYSIPKTSQAVQAKIKSSVETMTGMSVRDVNVRVINVEL